MPKKLTIHGFVALPDSEKADNYIRLSDRDKFLWRTYYEPLIPVGNGVKSNVKVRDVSEIPEDDEFWKVAWIVGLKFNKDEYKGPKKE